MGDKTHSGDGDEAGELTRDKKGDSWLSLRGRFGDDLGVDWSPEKTAELESMMPVMEKFCCPDWEKILGLVGAEGLGGFRRGLVFGGEGLAFEMSDLPQ